MLMNTGSIIRYESWEPTRQGSPPQFTSRLLLNVAENLAAAFDLDLAVADRPRDPAGRLDQEPVADDQITFEAAAYLGLVDRCRALEQAALGNLDSAAVGQLGVDTACPGALGNERPYREHGSRVRSRDLALPAIGLRGLAQKGQRFCHQSSLAWARPSVVPPSASTSLVIGWLKLPSVVGM